MSETTTSAPAAPATGPSDAGPASAPPPSSQTPLSISEAGRLLRQQRQANGEAPAPESTGRKPSVTDAIAAAATKAVQAPAAPPAPTKAATGLSAMERALGVPGEHAPDGAPAAPPPTAPGAGTVEIEGQHYSQAQIREYVLKASDYTQKTQQLAQERSTVQQQAQQLQAQQKALADVLPYIQPELVRLAEQLQRAEASQMPDPALAHTDPTAYVQQRAAYDAAVAEQQRLGSLTALQQQAHERAMAQQVAASNEQLAREFPFWADPAERLAAQQQIVDWAVNKGGFTRDELRGLSDARQLKAMMKASLFDRWVEGAKTSAPPQQLNAPPRGAPPPPPPTARLADAEARFEQKPDWRSAAALLGARRANSQR